MKQDIKVFVITLKNSKRFHILKKRLKELKIEYTQINGINGLEYYKKKKLYNISEPNKIFNNIGREMSPSEIGAAASHLKTYNYILKNNIKQAIIMEDDAYPSKKLCEWIKNNVKTKNNEIVSFYAYPSGFIEKKYCRKVLKNIGIHKAKTHLFNNSCYTINNYTAKRILKITKSKVIGYADWPFNTFKDKINLFVTIPFMTIINDRGISYLIKTRNKLLVSKFDIIKKLIPKVLFRPLAIIFYLLFVPFIFRKYKNFNFYIEHFFLKNFYALSNTFFRNYFDQRKIFYNTKFYLGDLTNEQKIMVKNKHYKIS
tara:strand:+ start:893 stop:1834 length:942 start_codon:yes stop_codon:yes gene_type:complete